MTEPAAEPSSAGPAVLDLDEVALTRAERFLSVVLAVFLFIGMMWAYTQPLDRTDDQSAHRYASYGTSSYAPLESITGPPDSGLTPDQQALRALDAAQSRLGAARQELDQARTDETTSREAYRTLLDAGQPGLPEKAAYERAQARRAAAERAVTTAETAVAAAEPAANAAQARIDAAFRALQRDTFLLRLGFTVAVLVISLVLLDRQRRRRSRWQATGTAAVGASTLLAVVMTGDYLNVRETGPIVLSVVGSAATIAAFLAYQRWLRRRLPARRARREECVACGHPAGSGQHCAGCGRPVLVPCPACGADRRVGARFCATCGAEAGEPVR